MLFRSHLAVMRTARPGMREYELQAVFDAACLKAGLKHLAYPSIVAAGVNGAVLHYLRNDALNSNNPFLKAAGVRRPVLKRNVFGGTLGGPIQKEKAFFFISYQGTRERNAASRLNSLSSNVLVAPGLTDDRSEDRKSTRLNSSHRL